jgi:hypothetical protein
MYSTEIRHGRALVLVVGLIVAALVYFDGQRPATGSATPTPAGANAERSSQASEAEAAIARAGLVSKLQATLGDAFGGVWFDSATAQLHVATTSAESRRLADRLAAGAGLAGTVTATPVRSSWDQLLAAQEQLNRGLADLLAQDEVTTAIAPDLNAVTVGVGSAVPPARRAALEDAAAALDVSVEISTLTGAHERIRPLARCKKFEASKAYCDPSLVSGTTMVHEAGSELCTAGVTAMPNDATKSTDTYVLTAGHCVSGGGENDAWYGFPTAGGKGQWIGYEVQNVNGAMDIGAIKVDGTGYWVTPGFTPVNPTIAQWSAAAESEPEQVKKQETPVKGVKTCYSGQKSGTTCGGTIKAVNVTVGGKEKLVEVEGIHAAEGDSGAPFFTEAAKSQAEGILVGEVEGKGIIVFHSLADSFAKLNELGLNLKLLTESNRERHFKFEAESAPVTLTGQKDAAGEVLTTTAGNLQCTGVAYTGTLPAKAVTEFELAPTYTGCTFAGVPATVDVNGCKYRFTVVKISGTSREGSMDVICPAEKTILITAVQAGTPKCTVHISPQAGRQSVTYTNVGAGATREITVDLGLAGIKYTHTAGVGLGACTFGGAENGMLSGSISITGENGSGTHVGIFTS